MFVVWDNGGILGRPSGPVGNAYQTRRRAQGRADRLNLEYGAHRYTVRQR